MQGEGDNDQSNRRNRKRQRQDLSKVPSTPTKSETTEECEETLTPHTMRLLKLIQEGSTEHAQLAATHLSVISAQSSPIVLWDILGRLQFFLNSPDWRTRRNASVAMEGVAQHLPIWDQRSFLQDVTLLKEKDHVWLTLLDLKGKMDVILKRGRHMLAFAEEAYGEDEQLEKMDQDLKGSSEFCEHRLQLQRRILARRLGLSDAMSNDDRNEVVNQVLSGTDDLIRNVIRPKKKAKETEVSLQKSLRALLVMEIRQQQQAGEQRCPGKAVSHRNSQVLLAGELVYRMFDSSWHVRHGSLMGILALVRAWKVHQLADNFGSWPHDLLARTLCLVGLDRFADYSGASMDSTGGAVAPVREMAGQVFSVIFPIAPPCIQRDSFDVLGSLVKNCDWEVRHGALVALKYCIALMCSPVGSQPLTALQQALLGEACTLAVSRLGDESDDVQSCAAQILLLPTGDNTVDISQAIFPLWRSIENSRFVSSAIKDLVRLFDALVSRDCERVLESLANGGSKWTTCHRILAVLKGLLGCEYVSVRCSVLHTIASITNQIPASDNGDDTDLEAKNEVAKCFSDTSAQVFELYLDQFATAEDNGASRVEEDRWLSIWNESWALLTKASSKIVLLAHDDLLSTLHDSLLLRYANSSGTMASDATPSHNPQLHKASHGRYLQLRIQVAKSLSSFLVASPEAWKGAGREMLSFCISSGLQSPFLFQFESACLLFQALAEQVKKIGTSTTLGEALLSMQKHVLSAVEAKPCCLEYARIDGFASDTNAFRVWTTAFTRGVEMVRAKNASGLIAANSVLALWRDEMPAQNECARQATVDSMRALVSSTTALVAGGVDFLPAKLTPLIRALMTSVQNERDDACRLQTCLHMSGLLRLISVDVPSDKAVGFKRTFSKMVGNLCKLIKSTEQPGCQAASQIIGNFANATPFEIVMTDLGMIWAALESIANDGAVIEDTQKCLRLLLAMCHDLRHGSALAAHIVNSFSQFLVELRCKSADSATRKQSSEIIKTLCSVERESVLEATLPMLARFLQKSGNPDCRLRSCCMLQDVLDAASFSICPYIRTLLPLVMPLMTDADSSCAKVAASMFSRLVQVAPLVRESAPLQLADTASKKNAELVMEHLIHGKKLPPCDIRPEISSDLQAAGISLREYQLEGVGWLRFLQAVGLNGALCDSMGLGKTLQALISVASSHLDADPGLTPLSLVVCPSSVVGHWVNETKKFFPKKKVLSAVPVAGSVANRKLLWANDFAEGNLVITSYSILRSDIEMISKFRWRYCILDEGHLLKNPRTATARASKQLICQHKLILTGTPVQNRVHEVWATFDFLMPNFLGSSASFSKEFAKPITKSQAPGASASDIARGIEHLKTLHQQVLPFILRREKDHVLNELPPKSISIIPCEMSPAQTSVYTDFCASEHAKNSLLSLRDAFGSNSPSFSNLGKDVLKSLLFLRLICTHPCLVSAKHVSSDINRQGIKQSGKLLVLNDLLRDAGFQKQRLAADNDASLLYCEENSDDEGDEFCGALETGLDESLVEIDRNVDVRSTSKCLIFAQFMNSLDVVETLLLRPYFPSVSYLRLDGRVPSEERSNIVDRFNQDDDIKVLLLTTRIGGLGLNLTGADMVVFLEHDWNPHADLQAMDRAHRIGQKRTVNVYKLVTTDSIEEKIMSIHDTKLAMSDAIVNTDNSSMYSLGTDRLLDIFRFRSEVSTRSGSSRDMEKTLDSLVELYEEEYRTLSMENFMVGLTDKTT